jgi:hypothetical protein
MSNFGTTPNGFELGSGCLDLISDLLTIYYLLPPIVFDILGSSVVLATASPLRAERRELKTPKSLSCTTSVGY